MSIKRMQCVSLIASVLFFASFRVKAVEPDLARSEVLDEAKRRTVCLEVAKPVGRNKGSIVGLMEDRGPVSLSVGRRAWVALVRTLLSDPQASLLKEPLCGLDTALRGQFRHFLPRRLLA